MNAGPRQLAQRDTERCCVELDGRRCWLLGCHVGDCMFVVQGTKPTYLDDWMPAESWEDVFNRCVGCGRVLADGAGHAVDCVWTRRGPTNPGAA